MSVTRVGTNKKYSDNWDNIFSDRKGKTATTKPTKVAKKSAKKKSAGKVPKKKSVGKKSARK